MQEPAFGLRFVNVERAATVALVLATIWLAAACSGPADAQGGPPPAAPVSVAPAVQRAVTDSEEFSGRLEATEYRRAATARRPARRARCTSPTARWCSKGELLFTIDPRPFEAEAARAAVAARRVQWRAPSWPRASSARAQKLLDSQAVSRQEFDQLTSGSRTTQADIQARRGGAARGPAQSRATRRSARRSPAAPRAPTITAGNLVNEQVGADDDRRRRQGLRLLRRQRADLPAPEGRRATAQGAEGAHGPGQRDRAFRTRARSTSSTTASTRRPARSACAPASTTRRASSRPGLAAQAAHGRRARLRRRCWCPTARSAPTRRKKFVYRRRRATASRSSARSSSAR